MGDIYFPNLGISIGKLDRVAFSFFGCNIYWYGILIATGVMLGALLLYKEAKRTGQSPDTYLDFMVFGIIMGVVGARSYYLLFHEGSLKEFIYIRNGGLAIYGGVIGGVLAVVIYTKYKKLNILKFTDTCAMSMLVGQIIGRWGNFVNREAFGKATNSLFAMALKADTVNGLHIAKNAVEGIYNKTTYPLVEYGGVNYIQVHPTFLYESFSNFILLCFMFFYRKNKKFEGEMTVIYFAGYGLIRFFIESLRTDQLLIFGVPVSMILSALLFIFAIIFEIYKKNQIKKQAQMPLK
jgi:phosphatidylglycerol:prolipoprotein diacylglycerol transferase